jgi:hypothetical protein
LLVRFLGVAGCVFHCWLGFLVLQQDVLYCWLGFLVLQDVFFIAG